MRIASIVGWAKQRAAHLKKDASAFVFRLLIVTLLISPPLAPVPWQQASAAPSSPETSHTARVWKQTVSGKGLSHPWGSVYKKATRWRVLSHRLDFHLPDVDGTFVVTFQHCRLFLSLGREPKSVWPVCFSSCSSKTNKAIICICFCVIALVSQALKILGKSLPFTAEISASPWGPDTNPLQRLLHVSVSFHQDGLVMA